LLRLQRRVLLGAGAFALLLAVLLGGLWKVWQIADTRLRAAQTSESLRLAQEAEKSYSSGDFATALLLAIEALPDPARGITRPAVPEDQLQLDRAIRSIREISVLATDGAVKTVTFADKTYEPLGISELTTVTA
jgi:hypothetical protein